MPERHTSQHNLSMHPSWMIRTNDTYLSRSADMDGDTHVDKLSGSSPRGDQGGGCDTTSSHSAPKRFQPQCTPKTCKGVSCMEGPCFQHDAEMSTKYGCKSFLDLCMLFSSGECNGFGFRVNIYSAHLTLHASLLSWIRPFKRIGAHLSCYGNHYCICFGLNN